MGKLVDLGVDLGKKLIPPPHDADEDQIRAWRFLLAGVTIVNLVGLTAHVLLACGLIPGFSGFANANETNQKFQLISDDFKAGRISALETAIPDMTKRYCTTKGELQQIFLDKLNIMKVDYHRLSGIPYPQINCSDLKPENG